MAFIPPVFSKLGEAIKNLLTKKYDFKHSVGITHKVSGELTFDSTVSCGDGKGKSCDCTGSVKAKYKNKDFGSVEGEIDTAGKLAGELALTTITKGLEVTFKASDRPSGNVKVQYRADNVAATIAANVEAVSKVEATLVAGVDDFAVGGQLEYDITNQDFSDYNFGSEYAQPNYTITVKTQSKAASLVGAYFYSLPGRGKLPVLVGGQVDWNLHTNARTVTIGSEITVDESTIVKAKFDHVGNVSGVIEHRLANPLMRVALSSQWDVTKRSSVPERFGVGVTFGDF